MSSFFPTVMVSARCSLRMCLGCDHVYVSGMFMLVASATLGEAGLVTTSHGISAEKKCACDNQGRGFNLSC